MKRGKFPFHTTLQVNYAEIEKRLIAATEPMMQVHDELVYELQGTITGRIRRQSPVVYDINCTGKPRRIEPK